MSIIGNDEVKDSSFPIRFETMGCYQRFKIYLLALILLLSGAISVKADTKPVFSRYDYLHGKLTPLRNCFDVIQYDITVKIQPDKKYISGCNIITSRVIKDFKKMQLDLFSEMQLDSILFKGSRLQYQRDSNAVFIVMNDKLKKGNIFDLAIYFSGNPRVAKKAPWDGGFVWEKDSAGNDWVGLACEGIGASCWLPCKDHWSDEADSMKMHLVVPSKLTGVSNGRLKGEKKLDGGYTQFDWSVQNNINSYNISINAGVYTHIHDSYRAKFNEMLPPLDLDYYVLSYNKEIALMHFKQTHKMLEAFEKYFGPYPFREDGYKLVETPYWGMEHQSCVAYGNNYRDNRWGFDFIIVHESGHEWFGNSITATDPAEMWIHESFTTYSEALYVEYHMGYESSVKYLLEQKRNIENKHPLIGPYDVYYHGRADNDIYYKGSWMLHTLRNVIDNDTLWFAMLKDLSLTFKKQQITTKQLIAFFNKRSGMNLDHFFDQYLYSAEVPVYEYRIEDRGEGEGNLTMYYRWRNVVKGFEMPVKITVTKGAFETVTPMRSLQLIDLNFFDEKDFKIKKDQYLINVRKLEK